MLSLSHSSGVKAPGALFLSLQMQPISLAPHQSEVSPPLHTRTEATSPPAAASVESPPSHSMGSPCLLLQASSVPTEDFAPLQPHPLHFLFASLELLKHLQAQPLYSHMPEPDHLHGGITGGQQLPAEDSLAVTLMTARTVSTMQVF